MTNATQAQYVLYSWIAGQVLARFRRERGVGQLALAEALGVSQATWSRVEKGTSPLTVEQLSHAAELLGVRAGDVISEVDDIAERYRDRGTYVVYKRDKSSLNIPALAAAGLGLYGLVKVLSNTDDD